MAERPIIDHKNQNAENNNEWKIFWFQKPSDTTDIAALLNQTQFLSDNQKTPLHVFYYENNKSQQIPVTGDYDLACIIPNKDYIYADGNHTATQDAHGGSVSSEYGDFIISQLNQACHQTVFRHGAETQNIEFTQPIDEQLICITPSRFSYVIPKERMAEAFYDLVCRKKIIKWNPTYNQNNLPLSGKYFGIISPKEQHKHQNLYNQLSSLIEKLRTLYYDGIATNHLNEIYGITLKDTNNLLNQNSLNTEILQYKKELLNFLAGHQESDGVEFGMAKAEQLTDQLTDILLYQERLKAYLHLASQKDAPRSFCCFTHHDFFEDGNSAFIEDTQDRRHWIKTIEEVVEQTGTPRAERWQPQRLSTTDDIIATTMLLEKNEKVFDSVNRRQSSSRSLMRLSIDQITLASGWLSLSESSSSELSDNDPRS